jgi:hypothetical protein
MHYNLFRLFLVHKISIYIHIYKNRKRKRKKKKEKGFPQLAGRGGGIRPSRARAAAQAGGLLGLKARERHGDGVRRG